MPGGTGGEVVELTGERAELRVAPAAVAVDERAVEARDVDRAVGADLDRVEERLGAAGERRVEQRPAIAVEAPQRVRRGHPDAAVEIDGDVAEQRAVEGLGRLVRPAAFPAVDGATVARPQDAVGTERERVVSAGDAIVESVLARALDAPRAADRRGVDDTPGVDDDRLERVRMVDEELELTVGEPVEADVVDADVRRPRDVAHGQDRRGGRRRRRCRRGLGGRRRDVGARRVDLRRVRLAVVVARGRGAGEERREREQAVEGATHRRGRHSKIRAGGRDGWFP